MKLTLKEEPCLLGDVEIWDVLKPDGDQVAWFFDKDLARIFVDNFNNNEDKIGREN